MFFFGIFHLFITTQVFEGEAHQAVYDSSTIDRMYNAGKRNLEAQNILWLLQKFRLLRRVGLSQYFIR
nr:hypothetical transcript [Hymenolepis microstoma]